MHEPIEVVAVCTNIENAIEAINTFNPVLIFLDIDLEGNERAGFDLLKKIKRITFDIIFTTAYIDKNIMEIRACGIHYMVKPYMLEELQDAINKFQNKNHPEIGIEQAYTLKTNLGTDRVDDKAIWIPLKSDSFQIKVKNIIYCKGLNQYTKFFVFTSGDQKKNFLSTKGMGEWEKDLEQFKICRIHKSYLVNVKYIEKYTRGEGGYVTLTTDDILDVSKTGKQKLLQLMKLK
jgi:two-component system LytT family response regulator